MKNPNQYLIGVVCCLLATLSWGGMFPVMTHALLKIDPFYFTAIRYTLMTGIIMVMLYITEGRKGFELDGNLPLLAFFGTAGFAGFGFLVFLGQQISGPEGALSASTLMATMPMLGLLMNWLMRGHKPPLLSFVFILMSFFGVLLVISKGNLSHLINGQTNWVADLLLLIGALCWVIYTISPTYYPQWSPIKYSAFSTLFALPFMYATAFALNSMELIQTPSINTFIDIMPELLYMVLVAGVLGLVCWNIGNKILTPINGVLFMNVVPIAAFIISALDGVACKQSQIAGMVLTGCALLLNNTYQRRRSHHKPHLTPLKSST